MSKQKTAPDLDNLRRLADLISGYPDASNDALRRTLEREEGAKFYSPTPKRDGWRIDMADLTANGATRGIAIANWAAMARRKAQGIT